MSKENVEVVRQIFEAFNSEDIGQILPFAHIDFEVDVPAEVSAEPDTYVGHDGMRRYWESFQDAMEEIRFEPEGFWDAGEVVVVAMHITAKGRATAIAVEQRTAGVWTIHEGKILHIQIYASLAQALTAAGLSE